MGVCKIQLKELLLLKSASKATKLQYSSLNDLKAEENWDSAWHPIMPSKKATKKSQSGIPSVSPKGPANTKIKLYDDEVIGELFVKAFFEDKEAVKDVLNSNTNYLSEPNPKDEIDFKINLNVDDLPAKEAEDSLQDEFKKE